MGEKSKGKKTAPPFPPTLCMVVFPGKGIKSFFFVRCYKRVRSIERTLEHYSTQAYTSKKRVGLLMRREFKF